MAISTPQGLTYKVRSPAEFDCDPRALKQVVYDEHAYVAVIVSPNATAILLNAMRTGDSSYKPSGAAELVTISARDQTTYLS